jgi:hypothetical protein
MSEIGAWLDRHGLGQHAALFAAQDIDLAVLPALTGRDLKELLMHIAPAAQDMR